MIRQAALTLVLGATTALAQDIPDRPEKLRFAPIRFETPRARDYKAKLRNGIPAYIVPNGKEGTPLVRVTVSWRGGAYLDPKGKEGTAALFGSQLTQGGTAKLEAAKLEDRLEALAATLTSTCTETSGSVSLQVLDKDLAEGLDLLMQALTEPAFAQDRLDLAKRQGRQRVSRRNDDVTSIAAYQMNYLLFGENHFASATTRPPAWRRSPARTSRPSTRGSCTRPTCSSRPRASSTARSCWTPSTGRSARSSRPPRRASAPPSPLPTSRGPLAST